MLNEESETPVKKKRDYAIDCIKGLCMLLVIIDHCGIGLCPAVDCLEVPSFFIASGFLFRPNVSFGNLIRVKVRRLVIPYLFYALAYIIIFRPTASLLYNLALPANEPLWFLKTLAWIFLMAYAIYKIPYHRIFEGKKVLVARFVTFILTIVFAYLASLHHVELLTLIGLQQAIIALPLFLVGNMLSRFNLRRGLWPLLFIAIWLITARYNIRLHASDVGPNFLLFNISAISGFCAIYGLFHYIKRYALLPLAFMGIASLEILGIHIIVIRLLSPMLAQWYYLIPATVVLSMLYARVVLLIKQRRKKDIS
jgi:fucose 4-O-acetylase-like acetyltransferase